MSMRDGGGAGATKLNEVDDGNVLTGIRGHVADGFESPGSLAERRERELAKLVAVAASGSRRAR